MSNLSKASFFDAGANPPFRKVITVRDGRRVEERMPAGVVKELWVDKAGNECTIVMVERGRPSTRQAIDARRAEMRSRGFIEHHRCPLTQGTMSGSEFAGALRAPCAEGSYGSLNPCAHVKHVIAERVAAQHAKRAARDAVLNAEQIAREAAETKRANQLERQTEAVLEMAKTVAAGQAAGKK